jgi:3-hydroxybutyryl-CoA dehydratase
MEAVAKEVRQFHVGQTYSYEQVIDDKLVRAFADLTGDHNPIHLDDETAKKSRFGRRIAQGAVLFSIVAKVLGVNMPGIGTIYVSQLCNFKLPVFIGDTVKLEVKIIEIGPKEVATISTIFTTQRGEVVMDGFAEVKLPGRLFKS